MSHPMRQLIEKLLTESEERGEKLLVQVVFKADGSVNAGPVRRTDIEGLYRFTVVAQGATDAQQAGLQAQQSVVVDQYFEADALQRIIVMNNEDIEEGSRIVTPGN